MHSTWKINRNIVTRSGVFFIPFLAVLAAVVFILIKIGKATTELDYLSRSLGLGIILIVYFCFSSYELISLPRRKGAKECLQAIPGAVNRMVLVQILFQFLLLVIGSVLVVGWNVWRYTHNAINYSPYLQHILLCGLLYLLLPGVVSIMLGTSLSGLRRPGAYAIMLLFSLLASGYPMLLFSPFCIGKLEVASLLDWFSFIVPNSEWAPDGIYGIGVELCRWILIGFWISLFAAILLYKQMRLGGGIRRFTALCMLVLCVLCGIQFAGRNNTYIMNKDSRPSSTLYSEWNYRKAHQQTESQEPAFSVIKYDLSLKIRASLRATATLTVSPNSLTTYDFTLYHGYTVSSVYDGNGKALPYQQDGDHIHIEAPDSLETVVLQYEGNADKYYANYQAICLPGYFPYYPMAGKLSVWDYVQSAYLPITGRPEAEFNVTVDAPTQVVSNLPSISENCFQGRSDSVTLLAGFVHRRADTEGVIYTSPLMEPESLLNLQSIERQWHTMMDRFDLPIELSLNNQTVFYLPLTIRSSNGNHESFVALNDTIFVCDLNPSANTLCANYFSNQIPDRPETAELKRYFMDYVMFPDSAEGIEKPPFSAVEIFLHINSPAELNMETEEEWNDFIMNHEEPFRQLFIYQVNHVGEKKAIRMIYDYLTTVGPVENQAVFLYNLGGEEDAEH